MTHTWKIMTVHNFYIFHNEAHKTLHLYTGFKIFLLFETDEESFHKFLPSNETQSLLIRRGKVLHVLSFI